MKITLCMGSSCFSRQNKHNLQVIQDFLNEHGLQREVRLEGTLCVGNCGKGPNVCIDEIWYNEVTEPMLINLLKEKVLRTVGSGQYAVGSGK